MIALQFKVNNFDLIRLLAAAQVVFMHTVHHLNIEVNQTILNFLDMFPGVAIFFVVSGFLISASFERSPSLPFYFFNRALRIFPALWFSFLFSLLTVFTITTLSVNWSEFMVWMIAQLTVVQFYNPEFMRGYGVGVLNGSLWTIPVELQFYLLLPIMYWFFNKLSWHSINIILFLLILIAINQFLFFSLETLGRTTITKLASVTVFPYLYLFFIGIILQKNKELVERYLSGKFIYIFLIYVGGRMVFSDEFHSHFDPISSLVLALLVISFAYSHTARLSDICKGYDISYGIYIYHMIFVNLFLELALFSPVVSAAWVFSLTVVMAVFSWVFIEKKALAFKSYSLR